MYRHTLLLPLLLAGSAAAQIVVPSRTHPTIQSGIDAATPGQVVRVLPGAYKENLTIKGTDITLTAIGGAENTVIDGAGAGPTLSILAGATRKCVIENLTFTGGLATGGLLPGGGIYVSGSSPTIQDCIIRGNSTPDYGGGIGVTGTGTGKRTEPLILRCRILDNRATTASYGSGGGLCFIRANSAASPDSPVVRECHFEGNVAKGRGGALFAGYGFATEVESCTFTRNQTEQGTGIYGGSAIFCSLNSPFVVRNCRLWDNECPSTGSTIKYFNVAKVQVVNTTVTHNKGGGIGGFNNSGAYGNPTSCDVTNSILWANGNTSEVTLSGTNPTIQITYSTVSNGHSGTGNSSADPMLANGATGNHRLLAGSPCIDAGTASGGFVPKLDFEGDARPIGGGIDIGADERSSTAQMLWADAAAFSVANPTTVNFHFDCPGEGGALYLLLPGLSGTSPGLNIGSLHLPLNVDAVTLNLLPVLPGLIGTLDKQGTTQTKLLLTGIPKPLIGVEISFAGLMIRGNAFTSATNSETLEIAP